MISFACPNCSTTYSAAEEHAGKRTTCKTCGEKFLIPSPAGNDLPYSVEPSVPTSAPVPEPEPIFVAPAPPPEPPAADLSVPVELEPCPKCQAKMSVRPEDVGFDLQCPFCQTIFQGVAASSPAPKPSEPEPAPAPPEAEGVEIAPCPKCRAELTVDPADLGSDVECPFCQTVYTAKKPAPKANTLLARPSKAPAPPPPKGQKSLEEDDGDTAPIKVKYEKERDPDDDDDDYRPRRKKRKKRRPTFDPYDPYEERETQLEPSDGVTCLMLGLATFFCCIFVAFWAIPQCNDTIAKVNAGQMEEGAKPLAYTGLILAYIAIALTILSIFGNCILAVVGGGR